MAVTDFIDPLIIYLILCFAIGAACLIFVLILWFALVSLSQWSRRVGKRWTVEDDSYLTEAFHDRVYNKVIARKLGRSIHSIRARITILKLHHVKLVPIEIRVTPNLKERLAKAAAQKGMGVSAYINKVLRENTDNYIGW